MKKNDQHIDHLIRRKLESYEAEPSTAVWEGILTRYEQQASKPFLNPGIRKSLRLSLLTILAFILLSDQSFRDPKDESDINHLYLSHLQSISLAKDEKNEYEITHNNVKAKSVSSNGHAMSDYFSKKEMATPESRNQLTQNQHTSLKSAISISEQLPSAERSEKRASLPLAADQSISFPSSSERGMGSLHNIQVLSIPRHLPSGLRTHDTYIATKQYAAKTPDYSSSILRPTWGIGLFYIPELYHSANMNAERTLLGFETLLRFSRNRYTLETGIGFSRVSNDNLFKIDYNAYLGSYKALDSINFTIDPNNQTPIPHYYYNEITVFDTATQTYFTRMKNQYTYVQIPLFLGYRSRAFDRVTFTFKGGPMLALLVGSREPDAYFDPKSQKIVKIQDRTPGRVRNSWQFLMNSGVSLQTTQHLSLSLEPGLRFHLNPIYEQDGTRPWSVNLRMGILYEF